MRRIISTLSLVAAAIEYSFMPAEARRRIAACCSSRVSNRK